MYITLSRRTVRLGSLQGVYKRFPKRNIIGIVHLHSRDCTGMGPSRDEIYEPFKGQLGTGQVVGKT